MLPTEELKNEHRGIERMLAIGLKSANRLQAGQDVPPEMFQQMVEFLRGFADKCHHGKEEDELFPAMVKAGIPQDGGPIAVMLADHKQGRQYVSDMGAAADRFAAGDLTAKRDLIVAIQGYVNLLQGHIYKEDNILYPMANSVLSAGEQTRLAAAFENVEATRMGPGVHERFHKMLDDMEAATAAW